MPINKSFYIFLLFKTKENMFLFFQEELFFRFVSASNNIVTCKNKDYICKYAYLWKQLHNNYIYLNAETIPMVNNLEKRALPFMLRIKQQLKELFCFVEHC